MSDLGDGGGERPGRGPHRRRAPLGVPGRRRARPGHDASDGGPGLVARHRRARQAAGRRHLGRARPAGAADAGTRRRARPRPIWSRWSASGWRPRSRGGAPGLDRDAYRVVHAESDGLPGLVVDRYADAAVVQTTSVAMNAARAADRRARAGPGSTRAIVVARDDGSARDFEELPRFAGVVARRRRHARRLPPGSATSSRPTCCATARPAASSIRRTTTPRSAPCAPPGARCLDAFTYHGGFALALARGGGDGAGRSTRTRHAVARAAANARRNGLANLKRRARQRLRPAARSRGPRRALRRGGAGSRPPSPSGAARQGPRSPPRAPTRSWCCAARA